MSIKKSLEQKYPLISMKRNCPVCQNTKGLTLGNLKFSLFDDDKLSRYFDVVSCDLCGLVFLDTSSTQEDYNQFYARSFYSTSFLFRNIPHEEQRYFDETVRIIHEIIPDKTVKLFDIGCGIGSLLKSFNKQGYINLYAVDPAISCIEELKKFDYIKSDVGNLAHLPFSDTQADLIILSHIIEHIIDLPTVMQNLHHKLSDDGFLYVEVPDATRYEVFNPSSPLRFFYFQHVIHFSEILLSNLMVRFGFKKIQCGKRDRVDSGFIMPCLWGVYKKCTPDFDAIQSNYDLGNQISKWFDDYAFDTDGVLGELVKNQTPVYIWGIGIHTQMMLAMSPLGRCNIKYMIDKDDRIQNKTIDGRKIYPIDKLLEATENDTVIIGPITHGEAMKNYLINDIGFKGKVMQL